MPQGWRRTQLHAGQYRRAARTLGLPGASRRRDQEAPGLHRYFATVLPEEPKGGVVDMAHEFLEGAQTATAHAVRVDVEGGPLDLLAAT